MVASAAGSVSIAEIAAVAHLRMHELPPGVEPLLEAVVMYEPAVSTGVYSDATHGAVVAVETGALGGAEVNETPVTRERVLGAIRTATR